MQAFPRRTGYACVHLIAMDAYRKHTARLPADLLWMEWIQGRKRELWDVRFPLLLP